MITLRLRPIFFVPLFLLSLSGYLKAQDNFKISAIREISSADLIEVGGNWRKDLPKRLLVTLHAKQEVPASSVSVKAYFYDKDNNLLVSCQKPNQIWTKTNRGFESVSLPPVLKKGTQTNVYFALPEDLQSKHWKTVLIVFGNSSEVAARSRPETALPNLVFPESSLVIRKKP